MRLVSINLLNEASSWDLRRPLVLEGLAELQPDVIALQEVALPENTAAWLAQSLGGYTVHLCPKSGKRREQEALAILSRLPVERTDWLALGSQYRVAQWIRVQCGDQVVVVANAHLHWWPGESQERTLQVQRMLRWLEPFIRDLPVVVVGDFNGVPDSIAIQTMKASFQSAYAARHGHEPEYTCPTPVMFRRRKGRLAASYLLNLLEHRRLRRWRGTLDYIFVNDRIRVLECDLALNHPSAHDPSLYPSDHFGLVANLDWRG